MKEERYDHSRRAGGSGGRLGQVLVESQAPGDGSGHPDHLQGVGHAGAVMVPFRLKKHLGLML